jgi:hypothetical protein
MRIIFMICKYGQRETPGEGEGEEKRRGRLFQIDLS